MFIGGTTLYIQFHLWSQGPCKHLFPYLGKSTPHMCLFQTSIDVHICGTTLYVQFHPRNQGPCKHLLFLVGTRGPAWVFFPSLNVIHMACYQDSPTNSNDCQSSWDVFENMHAWHLPCMHPNQGFQNFIYKFNVLMPVWGNHLLMHFSL